MAPTSIFPIVFNFGLSAFDAKKKKITNVADPTDATDAINLRYFLSYYNNEFQNKESRNEDQNNTKLLYELEQKLRRYIDDPSNEWQKNTLIHLERELEMMKINKKRESIFIETLNRKTSVLESFLHQYIDQYLHINSLLENKQTTTVPAVQPITIRNVLDALVISADLTKKINDVISARDTTDVSIMSPKEISENKQQLEYLILHIQKIKDFFSSFFRAYQTINEDFFVNQKTKLDEIEKKFKPFNNFEAIHPNVSNFFEHNNERIMKLEAFKTSHVDHTAQPSHPSQQASPQQTSELTNQEITDLKSISSNYRTISDTIASVLSPEFMNRYTYITKLDQASLNTHVQLITTTSEGIKANTHITSILQKLKEYTLDDIVKIYKLIGDINKIVDLEKKIGELNKIPELSNLETKRSFISFLETIDMEVHKAFISHVKAADFEDIKLKLDKLRGLDTAVVDGVKGFDFNNTLQNKTLLDTFFDTNRDLMNNVTTKTNDIKEFMGIITDSVNMENVKFFTQNVESMKTLKSTFIEGLKYIDDVNDITSCYSSYNIRAIVSVNVHPTNNKIFKLKFTDDYTRWGNLSYEYLKKCTKYELIFHTADLIAITPPEEPKYIIFNNSDASLDIKSRGSIDPSILEKISVATKFMFTKPNDITFNIDRVYELTQTDEAVFGNKAMIAIDLMFHKE